MSPPNIETTAAVKAVAGPPRKREWPRVGWPRRGNDFFYPIPPAPRTAVLVPGFRGSGNVKVFAEGWCERAAKFAPQAIAGTLGQLEAVAATPIEISHAIIVIGRWDDARVREADRDALWRRFRVPLFEQIVEEDATLAAFECEAHYGLHLASTQVRPRLRESDRLEEARCACGTAGARLILREEIEREENMRKIATYAR